MCSHQGKGRYLISYPNLPTNVTTLPIEKEEKRKGEEEEKEKEEEEEKINTPDCFAIYDRSHYAFHIHLPTFPYLLK